MGIGNGPLFPKVLSSAMKKLRPYPAFGPEGFRSSGQWFEYARRI
jgi:hypothetical protein